MAVAIPLPETQPRGYEWLDDEPAFDPDVHLQLESHDEVTMLSDLGYAPAEIAGKATAVAASAPFRMLSDAGAEVMLHTARRLRRFHIPAGDRIERCVRGGCYRSRWLRDLCTSPEVCEHLERIYGVAVAPHPMGLQIGHLNYEPVDLARAVDKWHHDTLPLTYVLMVTDPASIEGGRLEYFLGTKHEAAELAARGEPMPPDRVAAPHFAGPGYAIALHGDMVVHRASPLTAPGERITMANGLVSLDTSADDQSRMADLIVVDDHEVLWTEWARFAAWRSRGRLDSLIENLEFTNNRDDVISELESAVADVRKAICEMRAGERMTEHYGG